MQQEEYPDYHPHSDRYEARNRYRDGSSHYIVKEEYDHNRRRYEEEEEGEEDLAHGLHVYHDYLPQLMRTPDLENAKPVIRLK